MSSKDFIKENFVLVAGLALPVLLVLVFLAATVLPKSMSAPPQYSLLFEMDQYGNGSASPYIAELFVRDDHLRVRLKKAPVNMPNYNRKKLYMYDAKAQRVREIAYSIAQPTPELVDGSEILVPETEKYKMDNQMTAPDGYTFRPSNSGHSGLINEIFVGGGYRSNYFLTKGNVSWKIPETVGQPYYYNINFLGWIIAEKPS